jgi:hypothetical protein
MNAELDSYEKEIAEKVKTDSLRNAHRPPSVDL